MISDESAGARTIPSASGGQLEDGIATPDLFTSEVQYFLIKFGRASGKRDESSVANLLIEPARNRPQ